MIVRIEAPSAMDLVSSKVDRNAIELTPLTVRGQNVIRLAYVTVSGDKGVNAKAILTFNGNTGEFALRRVDGKVVSLAFDEHTPESFSDKRKERSDRTTKRKAPTTETEAGTEIINDQVGTASPVTPEITNETSH